MFWVSLQYPYLWPNSKLTLRINHILIGGDGLYLYIPVGGRPLDWCWRSSRCDSPPLRLHKCLNASLSDLAGGSDEA